MPVSGPPVSGRPVSGMPVSGAPVSGVPVSGPPVSGAPSIGGRPVAPPVVPRPVAPQLPAGTPRPAAPVPALIVPATPSEPVPAAELVRPDGTATSRGRRTRLRLRAGAHRARRVALDDVEIGNPATGLLLGHDREHRPVTVRLFREEATRIALVGGLWAARMLAFRALCLGSRIVVFTSTPAFWQGFGRWATGRDDRVAVMGREQPVAVAASAGQPTLLIYDVGLSGPVAAPVGPWQAQVTVLRQLTAYGLPVLQAANLVMMQRLTPAESTPAASLLRLTGQTLSLLQLLQPDMLALLGGGADRYLWLAPTGVERQHLGAPSR